MLENLILSCKRKKRVFELGNGNSWKGAVAYFWFQKDIPVVDEYVPVLHYFLSPIVIVVLGTYLITDSFFDVYSMAVDTIFLCFLEDIERNDGSKERPYFMSKTRNLRNFLKNKKQ
ncbi:choline transporter-like protein 2 [Plakobranchus ocellatus]|uniref:Choline transporter-like protein n=1 Tax=Plakobranchus ocellatus TaxID=259542 RepID=A0AAV4BFX5_9GAST|nr:choline transporter-like protein 2 [Plakobranchus ocellatus]